MPKLTDKQDRFCQEYIIDLNATQAAIRAGYSKKTAGRIGNENLRKLVIKQKIDEYRAKTRERLEISVDSIVKDIQLIHDKSLDAREYHTALKAKELQGKTIGAFTDNVNLSGQLTLAEHIRKRKLAESGGK